MALVHTNVTSDFIIQIQNLNVYILKCKVTGIMTIEGFMAKTDRNGTYLILPKHTLWRELP